MSTYADNTLEWEPESLAWLTAAYMFSEAGVGLVSSPGIGGYVLRRAQLTGYHPHNAAGRVPVYVATLTWTVTALK